jgi:hypothetical protein
MNLRDRVKRSFESVRQRCLIARARPNLDKGSQQWAAAPRFNA